MNALHTTTDRSVPLVLAIQRQLITENRNGLKSRVLDALAAGQKRFVLDFTACEYVDSSGLGVLVAIKHACTRNHATLLIAALNKDLVTLFELTKCDTLFRIADSVELAIAALAKESA